MQRVILPPLGSFSTLGRGSSMPAVFRRKLRRAVTDKRAECERQETIKCLKFCSANEHPVQTPRGQFEGRRASKVWFTLLPLCSALCILNQCFNSICVIYSGDLCWTKAAINVDFLSVSHIIFAFCLCLKWQGWVVLKKSKSRHYLFGWMMVLLLLFLNVKRSFLLNPN